MATFSNASFNAASYASFRPTYPPRLFQTILAYHLARNGDTGKALDLGCGTGGDFQDAFAFSLAC